MPIADLGGINNFRIPAPAVVNREQAVGQCAQQAAQETDVVLEKSHVPALHPGVQPINAEILRVSPHAQQGQIQEQYPVERFVLLDVCLKHVEDVKDLPEKKNANEHEPI